ncbi:hypothetical protein GJ744_003032 [Endocarpon pusillum]|uniref:Uncharacterized protein n=1 Tax=Endocarpon pusillum TaxID=364733 RepID=A0A8H7DZK9_9EURO|nr:hypothetical protein GJ744_003032 [Endocarpon pusillum]
MVQRIDNNPQQLGRTGNVLALSFVEQDEMTSHLPNLPAPLMTAHPPPKMMATSYRLKSAERRDRDVPRLATPVISQPR